MKAARRSPRDARPAGWPGMGQTGIKHAYTRRAQRIENVPARRVAERLEHAGPERAELEGASLLQRPGGRWSR